MQRIFCNLGFCMFFCLLIGACAKNPVSGKRQLSFMSTKREISLGKQYDPQVQATFGVYDDAKLQQLLTEKGKAMAKISHRPDLPWEFKVMDSPVVNAFAVPGGYVYFTRGILAHFNSEAQMAGVLGHEIGHVTARHGARQQTGQILGQLGLIIGVIAAPELAQYADIANQGMGLMFLKFGRDHESESDDLGVAYSTKVGYDARHMADFFSTLRRIGEKSGAGDIPTFMSTHPDPADREKTVRAFATRYQQKYKNKFSSFAENRDQYLNMINGIVYGDDPKQGFVENNVFYHPELKFQFPVPTNWVHQNSPIQFEMATSDGKAMMLFTLAKGKTLEEAAQSTAQQYSLKVLESRKGNIDGNPSLMLLSEQVSQTQGQTQQEQPRQQNPNAVRVMTHLIQYNGLIYAFHGLTYAQLFAQHSPTFERTAQGFKRLSDPDKLDRQPERIKIVKVPRNMTFGDAMTHFSMPAARFEEFAILNGMEKSTALTAGMLIKTVSK
jgi:predicted Zn-dependent protease